MTPQTAPDVTHPTPPAVPPQEGRFRLNGIQVAASVLATMSGAMTSAYFGLAGTVGGAAIMSGIATLGSAVYALGMRRMRARLQDVQAVQVLQQPVQVLRSVRPMALSPVRAGDTLRQPVINPAGQPRQLSPVDRQRAAAAVTEPMHLVPSVDGSRAAVAALTQQQHVAPSPHRQQAAATVTEPQHVAPSPQQQQQQQQQAAATVTEPQHVVPSSHRPRATIAADERQRRVPVPPGPRAAAVAGRPRRAEAPHRPRAAAGGPRSPSAGSRPPTRSHGAAARHRARKARTAQRRWNLAVAVALVFAVAMVAASIVELVGRRPLAGETGGRDTTPTSQISSVTDDGGPDGPGADPSASAADSSSEGSSVATAGDSPSTSAGGTTGTAEPDQGDGASPSAPTAPSPSPTETPGSTTATTPLPPARPTSPDPADTATGNTVDPAATSGSADTDSSTGTVEQPTSAG